MPKKNIFIGLLAVILLATAAVIYYTATKESTVPESGLNNAQQSETKVLKLVSQQHTDAVFLTSYAQEKGFFEKYGLKIELLPVEKDLTKTLLTSGDIMISQSSGILMAYKANSEARIVANLFYNFGSFAVSRYPKERASEIKKAVVSNMTGDPFMILRSGLRSMGADPDKVEIVANSSEASRAKMLEDGEADFTNITSAEIRNRLISQNKYYFMEPQDIFRDSGIYKSINVSGNGFKEKNAEVRKFVLAIYEAMNDAEKNREATISFIAGKKELAESREEAEKFFDRFVTAKNSTSFVPDLERVKKYAESVRTELKLDSDWSRDLGDFVYTDFAKEATGAK